jgi:Cu+-exporting ATPase
MAGGGSTTRPHSLPPTSASRWAGTDVAMQSAQVTLVKGDLRGIARARVLSVATVRNTSRTSPSRSCTTRSASRWPPGCCYPAFGLLLSPMIAAAAMSLSSVSMIGNALRLRNAWPPVVAGAAAGPTPYRRRRTLRVDPQAAVPPPSDA